MIPEVLRQVYQHPLFTSEDLMQIASTHHRIEIRKGDFLLREHDISHAYYVIETGLIRAYVHDYEGNEITTAFIGDQQVLIEVASFFSREPTQDNFQCLTDCILWKIEFDAFQNLFHSLPSVREWGRAWLSTELYRSKTRATEIITVPALQRYLKLMEETPKVLLQAPLKHIASFLGITDTSLSRIRKEIADGKEK